MTNKAGNRPQQVRRQVTVLSNAAAALETFEKAVPAASSSLIERDSAIFRLIYTFETICAACKHLLAESEGIKVASANTAIRTAREVGWLTEQDAQAAIAAGRDRSLAFHMYRESIGNEIQERLSGHAAVLRRWLEALREHAAEGN